jgi:hypothetical protein
MRGTSNVYLQFGRTREGLVGYVDSDFAGDLDKRISLIGYVFTIGGCCQLCRSGFPTLPSMLLQEQYAVVLLLEGDLVPWSLAID